MRTFKIGQTVVHRSYGVGIVRGVKEREFGIDKVSRYYIVEINDGGAPKKVFVPVQDADTKLRECVSRETAMKVLAYMALGEADSSIDRQTCNRRYREYMELIHTGELMNIAKVYVSLRALQADKDLSFGERKLLDQAHTLLTNEFTAIGIEFTQP
jgi:CarD family transcriptional regulator